MRYKLMVADRSPSVQEAIRLALPSSEFEIFPFGNGKDVMNSLNQINPDVILLGLSLPEKDGYEVGFYLKSQKEFRKTPLIFLKGTFEALDQQKMAGLDYDEIVQKPFDSQKLAQSIKDMIDRQQNPMTLPEEPLLDEMTLKDYKEEIRDFIQQQILEVETELEQKMRQRLIKELKRLLQEELEKLKTEISKLKSQSKQRP
jgi:DNA-binding response OmpR family regulator